MVYDENKWFKFSRQFVWISSLDNSIKGKCLKERSKWFAILYSAKRLEIMEIAQFF